MRYHSLDFNTETALCFHDLDEEYIELCPCALKKVKRKQVERFRGMASECCPTCLSRHIYPAFSMLAIWLQTSQTPAGNPF